MRKNQDKNKAVAVDGFKKLMDKADLDAYRMGFRSIEEKALFKNGFVAGFNFGVSYQYDLEKIHRRVKRKKK